MKNLRNYAILALAITILMASCSIEKRSHMKGYHVTWNNGKNKTATKKVTIENDTKQIANNSEDVEIVTDVVLTTPSEIKISEVNSAPTKIASKENNSTQPISKKELVKQINSKIELATTTENEVVKTPNNTRNAVLSPSERMAPNSVSGGDLLIIIITILIPFLGVGLYEGIGSRFWISLILTLLFFLPGLIYSLLVVTGTI